MTETYNLLCPGEGFSIVPETDTKNTMRNENWGKCGTCDGTGSRMLLPHLYLFLLITSQIG